MKTSVNGNLVRCTVFDVDGNVTVVSGEFRKSELLSKHGLLPRDLRKLDTGSYSTMPSILVRNNSILVNLLHIRALIKADMVLVFDAYGSTDSQTQSVFMYDLEGKLRQGSKAMGGLPYEMRALEAILISVVTALDSEMKIHTTLVTGILADLENNIDREKLRHLLVQSKGLSAFLQKATLVRDAINEVLEQDDDLAGMYLTEKLQGVWRPPDQHSEVEMLLESYYKHCDEIVQAANITMSNVRTTEEIVNIILDANRNSLMLLELKFSIGAMGLGGGALIAGLYGMNLRNSLEDAELGFLAVSLSAAAVVCGIVFVGLKHLRKVQRVTMMWERSTARIPNAPTTSSTIGQPLNSPPGVKPMWTCLSPAPSGKQMPGIGRMKKRSSSKWGGWFRRR
ncbi:inner membrane magnesium transporter MRS2 [Myxozyma melibiosi]|uniref:Magnesium transporter n=1 Tax=Myxozyma melibiosi TaxID=54550 RepID=A0ABR1F651_9ASCO